jgi:DNA helicase-2/ATP-dependent DNA helicase PcrA
VISLVDNYRSGQVILDAAHSLVEVESGPLKELRIPLQAGVKKDSIIERRDFSHQAVEDNWLVESVAAEIENGVAASEVAVIVRTNREVEQVAVQLRKAGLSVTASADGDVLVHPITQAVLGLIDVVITDISEKALFKVLHGAYFGIDANDLLKIFSAQSYQRKLWQILSSEEILKEIGVSNIAAVSKVVQVITKARNLEVHEAPHRVLEYILKESGFLNHVTTYDAFEGARVIRRLYDEIEAMVSRDGVGSLREVSNAFSTRLAYGLPLNAPYIETDTNSVQVMTAHKSKGLEFEVVFIPHLNDSAWSGANKKKYFDIPLAAHSLDLEHEYIEDERRLLYVAITRAKNKLFISTAGTSSGGRELIPARLLEDIEIDLITQCDVSLEDDNFNPLKVVEPYDSAVAINAELLLKLLSERGFSATSLNNYLRSPWDYFYRNVLRIPETQALPMQFGTAVHSVLEYATRYHTKEGKMPSDSQVRSKLELALSLLPIGPEDFTRLFEKGLEALLVYIPQLEKKIPKTTKEEFKLRVHLATGIPELPELILTGNIDRIDMGEDGLALRVVDYKTGKPKSRNVIEGNTKDADGGYKRQLVFYALLLSLHDDERYFCKEGVLSFVEPTAKGEVKEEVFVVTDAEIEELKAVIIVATKEIISGEFLKSTCDDKVSDYCELVKQLRR